MPKVPNAAIRVQQEEARHRKAREYKVRKKGTTHNNEEEFEDVTR